MTPRARREITARLARIPDDEPRLVLATGRYIGEGFDDARLDTLFLTMPVSWKGTLVQYAGRLHRLHPGKAEVRIYDYVDRDAPIFLGCWRLEVTARSDTHARRALRTTRSDGQPADVRSTRRGERDHVKRRGVGIMGVARERPSVSSGRGGAVPSRLQAPKRQAAQDDR
jgi:superfamily II DNA or RNA helicase